MSKIETQLYCVWRNLPDDDQIVAAYATSSECAKAMGIKRNTFNQIRCRGANGTRRWTIIPAEDMDSEERIRRATK